MYLFSLLIVWAGIALKWGKWNKFEVFYPTLMYYISFSLLSTYINLHYPLWRYISKSTFLNHTIIGLVLHVVIIPIGLFIYLSTIPNTPKKSYIITALWMFFYGVLTYGTYLLGLVKFYNGWNIIYATLGSILIFIFVRLHQHKPIWTVILTLFGFICWIFLMEIPIMNFK